MLAAKRQDGGLFKSPPYPGYPFIMIPDLTSPYLPNGSLSPTARTVSLFIYFSYVYKHSHLCLHSFIEIHALRGRASTHCCTHTHCVVTQKGSRQKAEKENTQSQVFLLPVKCTLQWHAACPPAAANLLTVL